ncbi:MAG: MgtC/SapB family protein [Ruminococcaceae bacterium]|nr:MgtC/SapB family protein [Oscillospiraceae bacterium]
MDTLKEIITYLNEIHIVTVALRLFLAIIIGGVIGSERGRHGSAAGLRTHILVCLGAALTSITSMYVSEILGVQGDVSRMPAQVISGIGFLGAGMIIIKNSNMITGLTTAAGMWATAAIGVALGYGFYSGAIIAMICCVGTAAFLTKLERKRKMSVHIYLEISDLKKAGDICDKIKNIYGSEILLETTAPKSTITGNIGVRITANRIYDYPAMRDNLETIDGIEFVIPE